MRIAMISEHASPLGVGVLQSHVAELSGALAEQGHADGRCQGITQIDVALCWIVKAEQQAG